MQEEGQREQHDHVVSPHSLSREAVPDLVNEGEAGTDHWGGEPVVVEAAIAPDVEIINGPVAEGSVMQEEEKDNVSTRARKEEKQTRPINPDAPWWYACKED